MKRIGITGGIATGKSTVTAILRNKNYIVIDADSVNHRLMEPGQSLYQKLIEAFGDSILVDKRNIQSPIDRANLGAIIFSSDTERKRLNEIAHPVIYEEILHQLDYYSTIKVNNGIIFIDIPLLFETRDKAENLKLDQVWLVYTDEEIQTQRLMKRNALSLQEAKDRLQSQMSIEDKVKLADIVIDNRGSLEDLDEQVERALNQINEWM